jgi:hypothetical protein
MLHTIEDKFEDGNLVVLAVQTLSLLAATQIILSRPDKVGFLKLLREYGGDKYMELRNVSLISGNKARYGGYVQSPLSSLCSEGQSKWSHVLLQQSKRRTHVWQL